MKKTTYYLIGMLFLSIFAACVKDTFDAKKPALTALNIINASPDVPTLAINFTAAPIPFYLQQAKANYASYLEYGEPSGNVPLVLVSSADTTGHIYQNTLNLSPGQVHSLYVYGTAPNVSTLLLPDSNVPILKDSVSGARIINLSPDAGPVNVSIQGNGTNDFTSVAFKSITAFKNISNTSVVKNNGGYNVQVTDASGNLLNTFNWNPTVFQNYTLVIGGSSSKQNVQGFAVSNY
jgi:hypothetical protein